MIARDLLLIVSFITFSCVSNRGFYKSNHKKQISDYINSVIDESEINSLLGISIVSLANDEKLYDFNSKKLLVPASNMKLFTAASSLYFLDPGHKFKTLILKRKNNLILKGGADPGLSINNLDSLALIISKQLNNVDTLFLDGNLFDSKYYGKGWMWDEGSNEYSAPVSGLAVNHNCIDFEYSPGKIGNPANISLLPHTNYVSIDNRSLTVSDTINYKALKIERDWVNQTNHFLITGEILYYDLKDTIKKNIYEPILFTGTIFKEILESHNVAVNNLSIDDIPNPTDSLSEHISDSMIFYLDNMMHKSENLTAESFIKYLGINDSSNGNWENGVRTVKSFINDNIAIDTTALRIADGSGLSRYNQLSADQIVQLLAYMNKTQWKDSFINILPHGGEKESSLEDRLTSANKRIYAKTGSMSGISCLSGYAFSPKYGPLAFSILINGFTGPLAPIREIQDQICEWLVRN